MVRWYVAFGALATVGLAGACEDGPSDGRGGAAATGGGCPDDGPPRPLFTIEVSAGDEVLPSDLTLQVRWSAGAEPLFELADASTWKGLEDGSNIVCQLPADATPPVALAILHCELWTAGVTDVEVKAGSYPVLNETLAPALREGCEAPVPTTVALDLNASGGGGGRPR